MIKKLQILFIALCLPTSGWAGVYKCTDGDGRAHYQSSPCTEQDKAVEINTKTGSKTDLNALEKAKKQALEQEKQLQAEEQTRLDAIVQRKQMAREQQETTQALMKQDPSQFSAYAIPPYDPDDLPALVKPFEERLPDIERFRRLAALKALASGQCDRVEADELNAKSHNDLLVFLVNCSSGASYYFNESELMEEK